MRSQWCREHIEETAENCGLGPDTVSDVKKAAKFCSAAEEFSDCATSAIVALIEISDEQVRDKAISSVSNSLKSGKHPLTGKFLQTKRLPEKDIKKVIKKIEKEVRGDLTEKFKEEAKAETKTLPASPYQPQPGSIPQTNASIQPSLAEQLSILPPLSPDAPMSEKLKRDEIILALAQKEAQLGFQTAANEKIVMNGGTVTLPPKYKITPEPMTEKEADELILQVITRWFAPKSKELWETILGTGELSDTPARLFEALVCKVGGE